MQKSLRNNPDVIRLFDTLEQNRLFVEKSQLQQVVEHIDSLSTTVNRLQEEISSLRREAGDSAAAPILAEAEAEVTQAKGVIGRMKERIADTAKRAVSACREGGKKALTSTLHAAHIPQMLSGLQQTLQDTERRLRGSVTKTELVSAELNSVRTHLRNAVKVMEGDAPQAGVSEKPIKLLETTRKCFERLANAFGQMSRTTGELKAKIPDLDRSAPVRQSVREKINGQHFRRDSCGMERQPVENMEL